MNWKFQTSPANKQIPNKIPEPSGSTTENNKYAQYIQISTWISFTMSYRISSFIHLLIQTQTALGAEEKMHIFFIAYLTSSPTAYTHTRDAQLGFPIVWFVRHFYDFKSLESSRVFWAHIPKYKKLFFWWIVKTRNLKAFYWQFSLRPKFGLGQKKKLLISSPVHFLAHFQIIVTRNSKFNAESSQNKQKTKRELSTMDIPGLSAVSVVEW